MKIGRIVIAVIVLGLFEAIVGGITCGWLFNWVYHLEPTNVWQPMEQPPVSFHIGALVLNLLFVLIYVMLRKGLPSENKLVKGLLFGLCVWAVVMLPGMFATYTFMTVAPTVIVYWTVMGLFMSPLKGLITAAIYGE